MTGSNLLKACLTLLFVLQTASPLTADPLFAHETSKRPAIQRQLKTSKYISLMKELQEKYRFSGEDLKTIFGQVQLRPEIIQKFEQPAELLPYSQYKSRFL